MKSEQRYLLIYDPIFSALGGGEKVLVSIVKVLSPVDVFIPVLGDTPSIKSLMVQIRSINNRNRVIWLRKTGKQLIFRIYRFIFLLFSNYWLENVSKKYYNIFVYTSFDMFGFKKHNSSKKVVYINTPNYFLWKIIEHDSLLKRLIPSLIWERILGIPLRNRSITGLEDADKILVISKEVYNRVYTYFNKTSRILYVPNYIDPQKRDKKLEKILKKYFIDKYFLIVSRILKYKNIQYLIRVYNNYDISIPLFIVGKGPYLNTIKDLARNLGKNKEKIVKFGTHSVVKIGKVFFWGYVNDGILNSLYKEALASFCLNNEDWGLNKVESLYWGTPVIAYKVGSNLELVEDGINGIFFDSLKMRDIKSAIDRFLKIYRDKGFVIRFNNVQFSENKFINELKNLI